jgi:GAF domain-containing protein/anti-sigma regulatory factor (Ser/Thr protein kinase)
MDADAGRWPDPVARPPAPGFDVLPLPAANPAASGPGCAAELHRYAAVAAFGRFAVQSCDISAVIGRAVESAAEVVHAPMAGLVRVVVRGQVEVVATRGVAGAAGRTGADAGPAEADAGVEWTVTTDVPADRITQPLIVPDWSTEIRFSQVPRLRDLGVCATLSVGVPAAGVSWLLTVHDHRARAFGAIDVDVVQAIAQLLGAALERDHQQRTYAAMIDRGRAVTAFGRFALKSSDVDATIERALEFVGEVLAVPMGVLARVIGPDQAEVVRARGVPGLAVGQRVEIPPHLREEYLARRSFARTDRRAGDPPVPGGVEPAGVRASMSVGLLVEGEPSRLVVLDVEPRQFTPSEQDFLQAVAHLLSAAIDRSRSELAQQTVAAFGRFALQSRDMTATIVRAVEVVAEVLDVPIVMVARPSGPGRYVMVHVHGSMGVAPGTELEVPSDLMAAIEDLTAPLAIDDWQSETRFSPVPAFRAVGVRSSLSVGVPVSRRAWRLVAVDTRPRRFRCFEVDVLQPIGNLLATALERQRAETLVRDSNRQLQQALLPGDLPTLPGITATARYVPAGGDLVGGDWYDVLPLPHGGIGLVMGDVEGHDSTAAAMMGQIRTVLRAYAADGHTPAEILGELNRFVHGHMQRLVTCCYAELHPEQRTITYASAGHPTPLILEPGRELTALPAAPGLILGVNAEQDYGECTRMLPHARLILMVTDGLVDDLPGAIHDALASLAAAAGRNACEPLETLADRLAACPDDGRDQRDDAALLAVELVTAAPPSCEGVHRIFANRPVVTRTARSYVADVLTAWGLPGVRETATLVVSELVTNAIMHTTGPIQVALRRAGPERIRLTVRDESDLPLRPHRRPAVKAAGTLEPGGRGLIIVQHVADRWGIDLTPDGVGKAVWVELGATARRPTASS